jgi:phage replication-related protein YjqB (UPF0714/DUF867 family)
MFRELLARPQVEERCELRARFGLMAFHGGNLERVTDVVAAEVAHRTRASLYAVLQEPPLRVHLASTAFDPAQSDKLSRFLHHVDVVIALHGYGHRPGLRHHVLVGGRNRHLARHVAAHLRDGIPERYPVLDELGRIPKDLRGQHARNPVNRPPCQGAQIELPPSIRWNRRERGWSDHRGISRAPDVEHLIDALSRAVASWPTRRPLAMAPPGPAITAARRATEHVGRNAGEPAALPAY